MGQCVDIQWPAGKTGLGRMVKPHPQKAECHGKQNQPEDPHCPGHNIQPLAESDGCRVVSSDGQQVVTGGGKMVKRPPVSHPPHCVQDQAGGKDDVG
ncbi:hypothetical protein DMN48_00605 [Shigella sonnei]|uniref:Uncharacterized protein n=1 Tax=Escherichia coli TaxID=562 RepID=A0A3B7P7F9_ECOLX|nr:hypothetical protein AM446_01250 [Escherichia coli]EAA1258146.1 hypothetical protein [Shigella sonnei]EAT5013071.1 hypothetical protein [Salmonella enterica]EBX6703421.1 hypothetical protein [Salmonella enterica subsp. enterica serovar Typhimurium]EFA4962928.1 hypothetical protein [Escherichia coli O2]EFY0757461.1 hypothetical protein [Shigella flexneri]